MSAATSHRRRCSCTAPSIARSAEVGAVVHLHSTQATAVACLPDVDRDNPIPPLTPYFVMRVGRRMPIVEYYRPGDPAMEPAIHAAAQDARAVLLANHGPVVSGKTLTDAVYAAEELEEAAKLYPDAAPHRTAAADAAAGGRIAWVITGTSPALYAGEVVDGLSSSVSPEPPSSISGIGDAAALLTLAGLARGLLASSLLRASLLLCQRPSSWRQPSSCAAPSSCRQPCGRRSCARPSRRPCVRPSWRALRPAFLAPAFGLLCRLLGSPDRHRLGLRLLGRLFVAHLLKLLLVCSLLTRVDSRQAVQPVPHSVCRRIAFARTDRQRQGSDRIGIAAPCQRERVNRAWWPSDISGAELRLSPCACHVRIRPDAAANQPSATCAHRGLHRSVRDPTARCRHPIASASPGRGCGPWTVLPFVDACAD